MRLILNFFPELFDLELNMPFPFPVPQTTSSKRKASTLLEQENMKLEKPETEIDRLKAPRLYVRHIVGALQGINVELTRMRSSTSQSKGVSTGSHSTQQMDLSKGG